MIQPDPFANLRSESGRRLLGYLKDQADQRGNVVRFPGGFDLMVAMFGGGADAEQWDRILHEGLCVTVKYRGTTFGGLWTYIVDSIESEFTLSEIFRDGAAWNELIRTLDGHATPILARPAFSKAWWKQRVETVTP